MRRHRDVHDTSFRQKKVLIIAFIFVFLVVGYFTFFNDLNFTGKSILGEKNSSLEKGLEMEASLTVPDLSLNSEFEEVSFIGMSNSLIRIGDLDLDYGGKTKVILRDFDGKIEFDEDKIFVLKGKAGEVIVNGELLSSREKDTKIELESVLFYTDLGIREGVFIRKLEYFTSGRVELGKNKIFNLDNESLSIKNFYGSVFSSKSGINTDFEMEGYIDSMEISGNSEVSVSA